MEYLPSLANRGIHVLFRSHHFRRSRLLLSFDDRAYCLVHLRIAGAAAKITAERLANFLFTWVVIVRQQPPHRHHESRRTEAALRAAEIAVGLLQRSQTAAIGHALDRGDFRSEVRR